MHEALRDAETGKAQHLQGNSLDTVLDDNNQPLSRVEADRLDLDEGEILKLPPTPDMTDGTEHQSDPETNKLHYSSRPSSGTTTPNSIKRRVPPAPPALPPRSSAGTSAAIGAGAGIGAVAGTSGLRPPLDRNDSSASHYSDALDEARHEGTAVNTSNGPVDGPPGYGDYAGGPSAYPAEKTNQSAVPAYDHTAPTSSSYPVEKSAEVPVPAYETAVPVSESYASQPPAMHTGEMDESERREWEQFHADQELAQRAGGLDLNAAYQTGGKDEPLR